MDFDRLADWGIFTLSSIKSETTMQIEIDKLEKPRGRFIANVSGNTISGSARFIITPNEVRIELLRNNSSSQVTTWMLSGGENADISSFFYRGVIIDDGANLFPADRENSRLREYKEPISTLISIIGLLEFSKSSSGNNLNEVSWDEFKKVASDKYGESYIFRGQCNSAFPLSSSFNRGYRYNLNSYKKLLRDFEHKAANILGRSFKLDKRKELEELIFIAQHHGYPTPFIDFTESPFIAAFFAFDSVQKKDTKEPNQATHVRVFCLNRNVHSQEPLTSQLSYEKHIISILSPATISNDRSIRQQALSVFTNRPILVDQGLSELIGPNVAPDLLDVDYFDISVDDRDRALFDLEVMGINRFTLFPDMDGLSQMLKRKHFK